MRRLRRSSPVPFSGQRDALPDVKVALLGRGGVGKSALTVRFICRRFLSEYDPTLEDTYIKESTVDGKQVRFHVMDTAGEISHEDMFARAHQLQDIDVFMVVFSVTDRLSFRSIRDYLALIAACQRERCCDDEMPVRHPTVLLVGNKIDLRERRQVSYEEAVRFAQEFGFPYLETSASDAIDSVFSAFQTSYRKARSQLGEFRPFKRSTGSMFDLHRMSFRGKLLSKAIQIGV